MNSKLRIGLTAGVVALAMAGAAQADNLVYVGEANTNTFGTQDAGRTDGPAAYASSGRYAASSSSMDLDVVGGQLNVAASADQFGSSYAYGQLDYTFRMESLDGSTADVPLQLGVTATGFADSAGRGGRSYIEFFLAGYYYDHVESSTLYNPGAMTYTYSHDPVTVGSKSVISIRMIAYAQANGTTGVCTPDYCGASAQAWIDPTFTLLGPNASNYRIVGVPGASVTPPTNPGGAVPEPSTWALMIAGFGLAGVGLRRRFGAVAA